MSDIQIGGVSRHWGRAMASVSSLTSDHIRARQRRLNGIHHACHDKIEQLTYIRRMLRCALTYLVALAVALGGFSSAFAMQAGGSDLVGMTMSADPVVATSQPHEDAVTSAKAETMADMSCCPDGIPSSDCGKHCMAIISASLAYSTLPTLAAYPIPQTHSVRVPPSITIALSGLSIGPPAEPPRT